MFLTDLFRKLWIQRPFSPNAFLSHCGGSISSHCSVYRQQTYTSLFSVNIFTTCCFHILCLILPVWVVCEQWLWLEGLLVQICACFSLYPYIRSLPVNGKYTSPCVKRSGWFVSCEKRYTSKICFPSFFQMLHFCTLLLQWWSFPNVGQIKASSSFLKVNIHLKNIYRNSST